MNNLKGYVILAPHVDDEVIGCFSILESRQVVSVYYFYELTPERKEEALKCAKKYGFAPVFMDMDAKSEISLDLDPELTVLVPSVRDAHPHHKEVNVLGQTLSNPRLYYSVDMNGRFKVLDTVTQERKRAALEELFPSQARLFQRDDKYVLFESIAPTDVDLSIEISTQFEGIHSYPGAPEGVEFLRYPHRHVFHVNVELEVFHDDRELEFILFKREIESMITLNLKSLQNKSCEMIGQLIMEYVLRNYPRRNCTVKVSEDGENGATVKYVYR